MPLLNGLAAAGQILHVSPRTKIVLLTVHTEDPYVLESLRAGVRGYVVKTQVADDLVTAIQEVLQGKTYLSPNISEAVVQGCLDKSEVNGHILTLRELQVLQLLAEGKTIKESAHLLGISVKTVESHRHRIMDKLAIRDTPGLVRYAIRRGVIQPCETAGRLAICSSAVDHTGDSARPPHHALP
jgi:DNA-binding NarL/FixJ family response regulator